MINAWKLTNKDGRTHGGCQWGEGVTHRTDGRGELCTAGWLHFYRDPLIGLFLNPMHAQYHSASMRLWECRYEGARKDDGALKSGATVLTTVREIECPRLSPNHHVAFAIYCAEPHGSAEWQKWACKWMAAEDRSAHAAAHAAAHPAAYAAAHAACASPSVLSRAAHLAVYGEES